MERIAAIEATVPAAFPRVVERLAGDPDTRRGSPAWPSGRSRRAHITVPLSDRADMGVTIEILTGPLETGPDGWRLPVWWRAIDRGGWFPIFAGTLEVRPDGEGTWLRLDGCYRAALGAVVPFGDGLVGDHLAGGVLRALIADIGVPLAHERPRRGAPGAPGAVEAVDLGSAPGDGTSDVAALAAYVRSCVDAAIRAGSDERALERRLLQRLDAALSAYETARAVLAFDLGADRGSSRPPLRGFACPACESDIFELIAGHGALHVRCQRCDVCWRLHGSALHRVDIETCLGCDRAPLCRAAAQRPLP